jgi:hypothetical protein
MNRIYDATLLPLALLVAAAMATLSPAADIVRGGKPLGAIWHSGDQSEAASDLVEFLRRMSGADIDVVIVEGSEKPKTGEPAIVLGDSAITMGLPKPPKTISGDGYCLKTQGSHLLMAGESAASTRFAVTHFLERMGCRWFMPNQWGEIIPERKTISLDGWDVREKPDFVYRNVWAFVPPARARLGGMNLPNRHDWQHVPAADYFQDHPEYYALRDGERRPGSWMCTTHSDVARLFAEAYIAKAKQGIKADTISPPDGRGFCQCVRCRALDLPNYIEPSSGTVSMSDRYVRFFDDVGRRVSAEAPNFLLSFYCYSDYTLPPKTIDKTSDNLCAWVTTIRFCRLHGIHNQHCESRHRYKTIVEGWSKLMRTACYDYNYNLAEVTVPISKISYFRDNIPLLKKTGCWGINLESMAAWNLYGPHTYLASRLMWDAEADVDAILDDYYSKLFGDAAPHVKHYWERIDRAVCQADIHVGSFYGLHVIWTPELVAECDADLRAAAQAANDDMVRGRVALFQSGLENVRHFLAVRGAINFCDFRRARDQYEKWVAHMETAYEKQFNTMRTYKHGYVKWFLRPVIESGHERTTEPRQLVVQLPDQWDFRYDPDDVGEEQGFFKWHVPADGWRRVKTYSATLNEQKIPEQFAWMWYRVKFVTPSRLPSGPLHIWFGEVDGDPTQVYLNGKFLGKFTGARKPAEFEITGKLSPGEENALVIKTGHFRISELMLGGILRPVMIYAGEKPPETHR